MTKVGRRPGIGRVAIAVGIARRDVVAGLARGGRAVVAGGAAALDRVVIDPGYGFQRVGLWQSSQVLVVAIWVAFLPLAVVPLWQDEQDPVTLA